MAVYTEIADDALAAFVAGYDIGVPSSCKGIAEGVENSNFLLETGRGRFILTLYEKRVREADLPFFLGLMDHLAARRFACPTPVPARNGRLYGRLCDRPAAIVSFLDGLWPRRPTAAHCHAVGRAMAALHRAAEGFTLRRANALGPRGWADLWQRCAGRADTVVPGLETLLTRELAEVTGMWPHDLPVGVIHADLFPDNVFFLADRLSGVIDFYFACNDFLAYDLAVGINAWCFGPDHDYRPDHGAALIDGYQSIRPLGAREWAALPILARGSALRFLLTRLYDWLNHPAGALVQPRDPRDYLPRLTFHRTITTPTLYTSPVSGLT